MRHTLVRSAAVASTAVLGVALMAPFGTSANASPATGQSFAGFSNVTRLPLTDKESDAALNYWTQARMDSAIPADDPPGAAGGSGRSAATWPHGPASATAAGPVAAVGASAQYKTVATNGIPTVGALFFNVGPVHERCTGTVINTSAGDIIATAAHCIWQKAGKIGVPLPNPVFVPNYYKGHSPYGKWAVKSRYIATDWKNHFNIDLDFGIIVIKPRSGQKLEPLLGANGWQTAGQHYDNLVEITGYPGNRSQPLQCYAFTKRFRSYVWQLVFPCDNYTDGVSGSLLLLNYHTSGTLRHLGTSMASLGGYQQGGNSANVSYAVIWNGGTATLINAAVHGQ